SPKPDDHALAARVSAEAADLLLSIRRDAADPDSLRATGDRLSHELITRRLADERPGEAVLSEEGARSAEGGGRTWVVDPLDGTREADLFVHAGGRYAWDTDAPAAVALAAGAHVALLDGSPVRFDCADPWTPDILVCRPELRDAALAALAVLASPPGGPATGR